MCKYDILAKVANSHKGARACMGAWRGALVLHAENKVKNDEERGGKKHS